MWKIQFYVTLTHFFSTVDAFQISTPNHMLFLKNHFSIDFIAAYIYETIKLWRPSFRLSCYILIPPLVHSDQPTKASLLYHIHTAKPWEFVTFPLGLLNARTISLTELDLLNLSATYKKTKKTS